MGVDPLIGMAAGSISMTGGHGTAGGFASVLEGLGLHGAGTIGMAAATFGLIAGSMIGGPFAERIIRKKLTHEQMQTPDEEVDPAMAGIESDEASPTGRAKRISSNEQEFQQYAKATYCIVLVMGAGTIMSWLLAKTGVTFPTYFGALILAAIARNTLGFISFKRNGKRVKADKLLDMDRIAETLGTAESGPSADCHSGSPSSDDGLLCLLRSLTPVRSQLRCCRPVCRHLWFRSWRYSQRDGQHECCVL